MLSKKVFLTGEPNFFSAAGAWLRAPSPDDYHVEALPGT
jgi:hypothetical protein